MPHAKWKVNSMKVRVCYNSPLLGPVYGELVEVAWLEDWDCLCGFVVPDDSETGIAREVPLSWLTEVDDIAPIAARMEG